MMEACEQTHLTVQRLCICCVSDNGGQAVQAHSAAVQLCDPLLTEGLPAVTGAALQCAVAAVLGAHLLLPKGVGNETDDLSLWRQYPKSASQQH